MNRRKVGLGPVLATSLLLLSGCGSPAASGEGETVLRVGYFPNITHAQALIGLARGDFQEALGPQVRIETYQFNAGPSAIEALFAGEIDLTYIGPNPAINGFVQSKGGVADHRRRHHAGAAFIVRPEAGSRLLISTGASCPPPVGKHTGRRLAQLLDRKRVGHRRAGWRRRNRPHETPRSSICSALARSTGVGARAVGQPIDRGGGGELFLDERDLWPQGDFVTAHIIASPALLEQHPDVVRAWLSAHVDLTEWALANPQEAQALLNDEIERLTGKRLDPQVLISAWSRLRPTWDPISSSLMASAQSAYQAGFLDEAPDLTGIYDLTLLNEVLESKGQPPVR
jgi:NitT/TauT family transport system substrate-binding protein